MTQRFIPISMSKKDFRTKIPHLLASQFVTNLKKKRVKSDLIVINNGKSEIPYKIFFVWKSVR